MTVERGVLSLARFMPESKMLLSFPCYWWEKKAVGLSKYFTSFLLSAENANRVGDYN